MNRSGRYTAGGSVASYQPDYIRPRRVRRSVYKRWHYPHRLILWSQLINVESIIILWKWSTLSCIILKYFVSIINPNTNSGGTVTTGAIAILHVSSINRDNTSGSYKVHWLEGKYCVYVNICFQTWIYSFYVDKGQDTDLNSYSNYDTHLNFESSFFFILFLSFLS